MEHISAQLWTARISNIILSNGEREKKKSIMGFAEFVSVSLLFSVDCFRNLARSNWPEFSTCYFAIRKICEIALSWVWFASTELLQPVHNWKLIKIKNYPSINCSSQWLMSSLCERVNRTQFKLSIWLCAKGKSE